MVSKNAIFCSTVLCAASISGSTQAILDFAVHLYSGSTVCKTLLKMLATDAQNWKLVRFFYKGQKIWRQCINVLDTPSDCRLFVFINYVNENIRQHLNIFTVLNI